MIWISFAKWGGKGGYFLSWRRIYTKKGRWTPFCRIEKRYDSWFEYWKKPDELAWQISVPDGHGGTASVTYKGERVPGIIAFTYSLTAQSVGKLTLTICSQDIEATMEIIRGAMEVQCE